MPTPHNSSVRSWGLLVGLLVLIFAALGLLTIHLQAAQARDTIRKHDIEDLEQALLRYARLQGTYPPNDVPTWCGVLSLEPNRPVRDAIEWALRMDEKYAKPDKPFPTDPRFTGTARDYFYWKRSPTSVELLSELEADANDTRDTSPCILPAGRQGPGGDGNRYDYGIVTTQRSPF